LETGAAVKRVGSKTDATRAL